MPVHCRPSAYRCLAFCWILCLVALPGCSPPDQESTANSQQTLAANNDAAGGLSGEMGTGNVPPENHLAQNSTAPEFLPQQPARVSSPIQGIPERDQQVRKEPADPPRQTQLLQMEPPEVQSPQTHPPQIQPPQIQPPPQVGQFPLAVADPDAETPGRGLRSDLTADELVEFLATADKDMQTIVSGASGITDPKKARDTLIQIVKMKWEASRRLAENENVDAKLRSEGNRGQLQALSHLASLGDLKAANDLKFLARRNLDSDDEALVSDSRLVLIGFGIEDLRNGVKDAPEKIVDLVRQLAATASNSDVPAMMVMGQARGLLANYGHDLQAKEVRDTIVDVFADSPDPNIAKMAAAMAGNVRFDGIDAMVNQVATSPDSTDQPTAKVSAREWIEAAETLIDESADLQTVQYLSGAAVEFESRDRMDLADATYEVMQRRFTDKDSATYQELSMAVDAYRARQNAIGREFDFSLPSVDGGPLSMADYRGSVVLMPFWTIDFPQSLQILPKLKQWSDRGAGKISIVGMNLDGDAARVQTFTEKSGLDFPSFRAPNPEANESNLSSEDAGSANPAAAQFGVVSLPCVVIFDQKGKVVKIDFAGRQLDQTIKQLMEP